MWRWLGWMLLMVPLATATANPEAIKQAADAANYDPYSPYGVFVQHDVLWLAPDGRYVRQAVRMCGLAPPSPVEVGRFHHEGDAIVLGPAEARVDFEYDALQRDFAPRPRIVAAKSTEPATRMLLVPLPDGLHLLDSASLVDAANVINASGVVPDWLLHARRAPPDADAEPGRSRQLTPDDRALLPSALQALLRDGPVEANTVALIDADLLAWRAHVAELRLLLDRGERDGVFVGMAMRSDGEGEFDGSIESVEAEHAVLRVTIERFHPDDVPRLPPVGARFVGAATEQDGDDTSTVVAASGTISAIQPHTFDTLQWDEDGFAFVEATLDIGATHGLAIGDRLLPAAFSGIGPEARVEALDAGQARLLLRLQRYGTLSPEDDALPAVGEVFGTLGWYARRWDGDDQD